MTVPIADGGEGTVEAFLAAGAQPRVRRVTGPLGEAVEARYAMYATTAVIEMAAAAGYELVDPARRDALRSTTFGVGELIRAALDEGATRVVIGLGGSATNDAGAGMLTALGVRLLDAAGRHLSPGGAALASLAEVDLSGLDRRLGGVRIEGACDVNFELCGPAGASAVFGPQKGASPGQVALLDAALGHFADRSAAVLGRDRRHEPSTGAAGGLGYALAQYLNADLRSGIDIIIEIAGLREALAGADLCVTGEGRIDAQTEGGKAIAGIARAAREAGVPVVALCGSLGDGAEPALAALGAACLPITDRPMPEEEAMRDAAILVERAAARLARLRA